MKKLILFFLLPLFFYFANGQNPSSLKKSKRDERNQRINAIIKQEEEGVITSRKHFAAGFKLIHDGYGGWLEMGLARSINKSFLFQLEVSERKHVKEEKLQDAYGSASPLIYGKVNFFYPVKLGFQEQFLIGNKGSKNGVSITANFGGGVTLSMLRPYLVEVDKGNGIYEFVGYNSPDSNYFLNGPIVGGPNFSKGWSQLKMKPGLFAKSSLRFDYGRYNEMLNAIEIGAFGEYYSTNIQQMIAVAPKKFFLGIYVGFCMGRRH